MVNCTFCGDPIPFGKGKMYVLNKGTVLHFCSNKCEKNFIMLGRKPRNIKWTKEHQSVKQGAKK